MDIQRERLARDGFMPSWVWHEHMARYRFSAQFVKDKIVVDCACGDGIGAGIFAQEGARFVEAFDLSETSVSAASLKNKATNLRFRVSSALKLPLPDRYADIFVSLETIEHLEQDVEFFAELLRVIKPDGLFVCSTPNRTVTNPGKTLQDRPWNKFHVREYSLIEFSNLLQARFRKVEILGQNPQISTKVRIMQTLGRLLPRHVAVNMNQVLKLPKLIFDKFENHLVKPIEPGKSYEYLVAVCRSPRPSLGRGRSSLCVP